MNVQIIQRKITQMYMQEEKLMLAHEVPELQTTNLGISIHMNKVILYLIFLS
jgi:hypothetical protein